MSLVAALRTRWARRRTAASDRRFAELEQRRALDQARAWGRKDGPIDARFVA